MNEGQYYSQLETAWDILKKLRLDKDRIWNPVYSRLAVSAFRGLTYLETWRECFREQFYNFQLYDNALLQFRVESFRPPQINYVYYECPYQCIPYGDFVRQYWDLEPHDVGDELMTDYETYLATCNVKETVTPIRYDYKPAHYVQGRHPASHVHFGHTNNVRVGTKKMLVRPLTFFLFVIRQCYPDSWIMLLEESGAPSWCRNVRESLPDVDAQYWGPLDEYEIVLH